MSEFKKGYYHAVANLILLHDLPGVAAEVLREYGPFDLAGIDVFDRKILRKLARDEKRILADRLAPDAGEGKS